MDAILQAKDLTYVYSAGTPFEHKALDHVSFTLNRGEFVGIIGHTGSGKSTLMQQLNGLLKPTSGQVLLDGQDIWSDKKLTRQARFRVGLVFQYPEYQLFEETVYEDVAFGPKNLGIEGDELDRTIRESIELVGLNYEKVKDKSPFELSGGQKRRVAIAGVIAMNPSILILDEPTAGLDPTAHRDILNMIRKIHKTRGIIIIFVSHNMGDVADMCDQVLVMDDGKIILDGSPEYVFSQKRTLDEVGLGLPPVTEILDRISEEITGFHAAALDMKEAADAIEEFLNRKKN